MNYRKAAHLTRFIGLYVDEATKEILDESAKERGISLAALVREIISQHLWDNDDDLK